jgi:uncharacterized protein (DUF2336 family)
LPTPPPALVGQLAREDEIAIAGPLLRRSPVIDEQALIEIACIKGQGIAQHRTRNLEIPGASLRDAPE